MSHNIVSRSPCLSIIIPARNEARRLPASLEKIEQYFCCRQELVEVVVVDNGSTDGTADVVRQFAESHPWMPCRLVVESKPGKGAAVRAGMLSAIGETLFQCDADLSMPIEELDKLKATLECGADMAIGCREGQGAVRLGESIHRRLLGRAFNKLLQTLELTGLPDTQCGFKVFRRAVARELFASQTITGWGFDVEILILARERGYTIASIPIHWTHDSDSRVKPLRDGLRMVLEVWAIRDRWKNGGYARPAVTSGQLPAKDVVETGPKSHEPRFSRTLSLRRVA